MTKPKKTSTTPIRSSAAEYLTFIAATGEGGVEAIYADEDIRSRSHAEHGNQNKDGLWLVPTLLRGKAYGV